MEYFHILLYKKFNVIYKFKTERFKNSHEVLPYISQNGLIQNFISRYNL